MTTARSKLVGIGAAVILLPAGLAIAGCGGSSTSSTAPATLTSGSAAVPVTQPSSGSATGGATTTAPSGTTGSTAPATQTINVDADPTGRLEFVQKTLTAKAGAVTFVLRNASSVGHNLAIQGNGVTAGPTATVSSGKTADLVATLKPGTYEFYCAVPGHKEAGMRGTLTVT